MISKIGVPYNLEALNGKKSRKNVYYDNSSTKSQDGTEFSSFAMQLSKYTAELKNIPDVREDLVAELKTQFDNGEYKPPLEKLASSLIMSGLLDNV